jgi:flavin-binding protein dodecin
VSVVKIVELVGSSNKSWEEAVKNAVSRAAKTIRNIKGVNVVGWTGKVKNSKIVEYRADVKISFVVEDEGTIG